MQTFSAHGGAGVLMSVGLFRRLPFAQMHRCVQEAYQTGGDSMFTECLWKVPASLPCHTTHFISRSLLLQHSQRSLFPHTPVFQDGYHQHSAIALLPHEARLSNEFYERVCWQQHQGVSDSVVNSWCADPGQRGPDQSGPAVAPTRADHV